MCVGVGCQNKDIKNWCTSKHTKDPTTDERLTGTDIAALTAVAGQTVGRDQHASQRHGERG